MTLPKITQENVHIFIPLKVAKLAAWLSEENNISLLEAIQTVYHSETYKRLEQENTKYWHLGATALYEELLENRTSLNHA